MAITYEPIATTTLSSATNQVDFTGISGSYTDLILILEGLASGGTNYPYFRVGNGSIDTGTNYSRTYILGDGSSASSGRDTNTSTLTLAEFLTTSRSMITIQFQNYSNTTTYKTMIVRTSGAANKVEANVALWRSTSAINQIRLAVSSNNFASGTSVTLYGIKAA